MERGVSMLSTDTPAVAVVAAAKGEGGERGPDAHNDAEEEEVVIAAVVDCRHVETVEQAQLVLMLMLSMMLVEEGSMRDAAVAAVGDIAGNTAAIVGVGGKVRVAEVPAFGRVDESAE